MQLKFYKQAATPNRINKSGYLSEVGTLDNVDIKADTDLMRPVFILRTNSMVYNSNYVFCEFTQRYYYIESIDALAGNRIAIHCKIDVLFTYMNEILSSSAWVIKSDGTSDNSDYNMLHNDYPFQSDYDILGLSSTSSIFADGDANSLPILFVTA